MGVSEALYIPAGLSLIADYHLGATRSLAVGIHMTGLYMGQALGGFGATVADKFSWQQAFQYFGLAGIVYSVVLIFFLKENITAYHSETTVKSNLGGIASIKNSLGMLLGMISFWVILFYFAAPSFPGWAAKNWLPTLFSESLNIEMAMAGPMATITIVVLVYWGHFGRNTG